MYIQFKKLKMKNKIKTLSILYLVLSLLLIIPIFSAQTTNSQNEYNYQKGKKASETCGESAGTAIKDSLVLSIATLCLPGIIEKVNEHKTILCEEVVCYYEAVKAGLDPTYCAEQKAYKVCEEIVGELFALPGFALLDYFKDLVANILKNPLGAMFSVGVVAARSYVTGTCMLPFGCNLVRPEKPDTAIFYASTTFLLATDTLALYQQLKNLFEGGLNFLQPQSNACEQLPQIENEMKEILGMPTMADGKSDSQSGLFGLGFLGL